MANTNKAVKPAGNKDDRVVYKAGIDMLLAVIALLAFHIINKNYSTAAGFEAWKAVFKYTALGGAVLTAVGVILIFTVKPKALGCWIAAVSAAITAISTILRVYWVAPIPYLNFAAIASAALYLVWILYPKDFFMIAFATTFTGFGFFLLHQNAGVTKGLIITYAAMFVVMVFFTWLVNKAAANSGVLQLPKGKMRLLGASPVISYVFYAALTACMIASIIFGATFAYYCIYVAAGALFVSACYYTIRLG